MGGAAAPAHPQQPRTYADRIAMGAHTTSCVAICTLVVATTPLTSVSCIVKKGFVQCQPEIELIAGVVDALSNPLVD